LQPSDIHPLAPEHLPSYIVAADGSDFLFNFMVFFTIGLILLIGVLYLTLHAMPERMAHDTNHSQMQVVGILALLALFTHNNIFWVIAILVAAFKIPDFMTPITSIAQSLATMAKGTSVAEDREEAVPEGDAAPHTAPEAAKEH
jgi:heme/copper-type cytochrome/quinol oxidase subunit 2